MDTGKEQKNPNMTQGAESLVFSEPVISAAREACLASLRGGWQTVSIASEEARDSRQLYVYVRPEYLLAQAILGGCSSEEVLDGWCAAMRELLSQHRQNEQSTWLIEATSVLEYFAKMQGTRSEVGLPCSDAQPSSLEPFYLALAALQVTQSSVASSLNAQLRRRTQIPPGEEETLAVGVDAIAYEWRRMKARTRDSEKILAQLHHTQETLEQYYLEWLKERAARERDAEQHHEEQLRERAKYEERLTRERAKYEERLTRERAARERENKMHRIEILKREIRELQTSTAWRMMGPLRIILRLATLRLRPRAPLSLSGSLDHQIRVLEQHLAGLHGAATWRVTKPLRVLLSSLRRS